MGAAGARDVAAESWRARLSRRLVWLTAALTLAVFVPISLGTVDARIRLQLMAFSACLFLGLLWLGRRSTPQPLRTLGVVVAFVGIGTAGYATVGFLSAPAVAFAAAVSFAGLLAGRRAMIATAIVVAGIAGAIGAAMVSGVLATPPTSEVSPALARPWLRSTGITVLLVIIIGAAVTWVVEQIEAAIAEVDAEAQRRQEAERQVMRAQSTELIAQLAASLAHDVNNQLTVIASWTGLAGPDAPPALRREANDAIVESIAHATALTRQMLMLGRRDATAPRPVDLGAFLTADEKILRALIPAEIDLTLDVCADAWCEIDPAQLHQVLLNLVMNARDAMSDGGALRVRSMRRRDAGGHGRSGPIPPGDWVVLSVEDDGKGMDASTRQRAFEPFFTTKEIGKGTGLGLATIAVIVERAGGHLALESAPGRGTRVEVWLPAIAAAPPGAAVEPAAERRLDGVNVLVAEDAPAVLEVARRVLEQTGAIVTIAADGAEALARIAEAPPDVLCSDVVMPGASVVDVVDAFRAANPRGVVLLCSGYVGEELIRRGIEERRYAFLPKPYAPDDLVRAITALCSTRSSISR